MSYKCMQLNRVVGIEIDTREEHCLPKCEGEQSHLAVFRHAVSYGNPANSLRRQWRERERKGGREKGTNRRKGRTGEAKGDGGREGKRLKRKERH